MTDAAATQRVQEARRRISGRFARVGWIAAGLILLLLASGLGYFLHSFNQAVAEVTDPHRYPAVLADLGYPTPTKLDAPTLASFPAAVPATATKLRLYYRPHFLQGGTQLQLRMALPPGEIAQILRTVRPLAKQVTSGGDIFDAVNKHGGLPTATFRDASNAGVEPLPADFQILVLDAKDLDAKGLEPPSWNRGYSYGVAISEKESEVIYWLEEWQ